MPSSSRPRVLLHAFSTFQLGGPQARFVQLANALGPHYEHHVVAMDNRFDAGERLSAEVRWQPVQMTVKKGGLLANRSECRRQIQRLRPDLLLSYNWGAIEWTAANLPQLVPQVHVEDGFGPDEAHQQLPRRVWTRRVLLGLGRVPLVVASRRLQAIATDIWKVPPWRVSFLTNGVALPEPALQPKADDLLCIGTVAGLRPEKNIARLIRAFAQLRIDQPARLVVVGDGPLRRELEALARSLGVAGDVEFTGYLANPGARLAEFDLFALSSDTEQLPIALLEAMAHGLPIVSTRVGDIEAVLAHVSPGNLCAPQDDAFAQALREAVAQRSHWPAWSKRARDVVETLYAERSMVAAWTRVFDGRMA
jgi:glycosyltransferase involved in cell wall biosynthesis